MPQSRQSNTFTLPNGNRVTITTGSNRSGFYKTVTVRRADGTSTSQTYRRRGYVLGAYDSSVPGWAAAGGPQSPSIQRGVTSSPTSTPISPDQAKKRHGIILLVVVAIIVGGIIAAIHSAMAPHGPYIDGYQWGYSNAGIITPPACIHAEMASTTSVSDPNFYYERPQGDAKPNDNFARWRAGCEAGARAEIKSN
ncbi:MAG: hypothetical protein ACYCU7_01725 [Acidimicrobiales bacterium]